MSSRADEVLYGGAASGGKSAGLLACPLRWIHNPNYRGLYLRRESKYLGEAVDKSKALYPKLGGRLVEHPRIIWTFLNGATIWFNHCEYDKDVQNYDSFEFSEELFDELTHFTEKQYKGIRARLRGTDPNLPYWSRAASNPGGEGHEWVFKHFSPWLDPEALVRALPGQLVWFVGEDVVPMGTPDAESRTFIPARLHDNPHITADYRAKLKQLDPVRRAQLLEGDWLKKAAPKDYWDRSKVTHLDTMPSQAIARVRCWDFGATVDGDWTVGGRLSIDRQGIVAIEHLIRFRGTPDKVHSEFSRVALQDQAFDPRIVQVIPQDPGQAGVDQIRSFINENPGITIRARRPTGDKLTRFSPASARAAAGMLVVVRGSWNREMHDELEALPEADHDDQCFVAGTLIEVERGQVPIEEIKIGERVLTRSGYRTVLWSGKTGSQRRVMSVELFDGTVLTGTENHPVFVENKGFVRLDDVGCSDRLVRCASTIALASGSPITVFTTTDIRTQKTKPTSAISHLALRIENEALTFSIDRCGRMFTDRFQTVITFIIKTAITSITRWITLSASLLWLTWRNIARQGSLIPIPRLRETIFAASKARLPSGIEVQRALLGTKNTESCFGRTESPSIERVRLVGRSSRPIEATQSIARRPATIVDLRERASIAEKNSWELEFKRTVPCRVRDVREEPGLADVYNLTIDGAHEYFANGILVHNCDVIADGVAVLTGAHQEPAPPPEPVDDGRWVEYDGRGFGG